MKRITLFFIVCLLSANSIAQKIASSILLQDGTIIDSSHIFMDGEEPTFYVENGQYENIVWSFSFLGRDGEKYKCIESNERTNTFTFKIDPKIFSGTNLINNCQLIEFPNDSSVYFRCSVDLLQNNVIKDNVTILLNVFPSRAKIKKASISGNFDFEDGGYNPFAELKLLCSSDRTNDFRIVSYVSDSLYVFQFHEYCTQIYDEVTTTKIEQNLYEIKYDYADWGNFYTIVSYNKYGAIRGDTIFTNDIIVDSEIVHFIEEYHNQITSIDETRNDDVKLSWKNNFLTIEGLSCSQILLEIYTTDGTLISRKTKTKIIDMSDYCSGVYIVRIKHNNQIITKKIFKR